MFSIDSASLVQRHNGDKVKAIQELTNLALTGQITFPFKRYYSKSPQELFANLKTIKLEVTSNQPYRLFSYFPRYNSYLPPLFRDVPTIVSSNENVYNNVDVLSDIFLEDVRLKAKRFDEPLSVYDSWRDKDRLTTIMTKALNNPVINAQTLRETIYTTIAETKAFNPSWAKTLLELVLNEPLSGKRWLDMSSGLGDRLLTAMALNMFYVGYDPNINLKTGHDQMIKMFGDINQHRIFYEPFEKANVPPGPYDVSLISPPFFTIEEYVSGQKGQSIVSYPDYEQWMVRFLYASLMKIWDNLKIGGYLILHLGDNKEIATAEPANIFIGNYLPGASWEGVIGVRSEAGKPRPVWVWRKLSSTANRRTWQPKMQSYNKLFATYPLLFNELLRFYGDKYAPNYSMRRSNAKITQQHLLQKYQVNVTDNLAIAALLADLTFEQLIAQAAYKSVENLASDSTTYNTWKLNINNIRDNILAKFSPINQDNIKIILADDLLIISLLETLRIEGTIKWYEAMIRLALL